MTTPKSNPSKHQTRPQSLLNTRAGARPEVYIYGYIPIRPYKIEIQITTGDESV
jgi:hypothetical protein